MKKSWQLLGLALVSLVLLSQVKMSAVARVTAQIINTDIWAVGPSGAEVAVDSSGNFLPTTDNDATLGTSALRWATAYVMDVTVGDDLTVTDAATFSGRMNFAKTQVGTGTGSLGVYSSSAIPATSNYETVITSGVLVLISAVPSVSTGTVLKATGICCDNSLSVALSEGMELILTSTASAGGIILQDEGTLTGSRLQLGAATRQVDQFNVLKLVYDPADNFWREVSFTAN